MLLTNKEDILKVMNKDIEEASASTVNWLAKTFNVPPPSKRRFTRNYSSQILRLMEELRSKSLSEAERDRNLTRLSNTGMGYEFHFKFLLPQVKKQAKKDVYVPTIERLEKLVARVGAQ
jgi:intergrase/recombinase